MEQLKSKDLLDVLVETYISKVTAAGQLTLPKEMRKHLRLKKGGEYVEVAAVGQAAVIRRLRPDDDEVFREIRRELKKSGLTRKRMQEILDEVRTEVWERRYGKLLR
jgi:AbrB family looped-hinge helix DNA binding protein